MNVTQTRVSPTGYADKLGMVNRMNRDYFPNYSLPAVLGSLRSECFLDVETKLLDVILRNFKLQTVNYKSRRVPTSSAAVLSEVHSVCDQRSKKHRRRIENWQFRAAIDNLEGFGEAWNSSFPVDTYLLTYSMEQSPS